MKKLICIFMFLSIGCTSHLYEKTAIIVDVKKISYRGYSYIITVHSEGTSDVVIHTDREYEIGDHLFKKEK